MRFRQFGVAAILALPLSILWATPGEALRLTPFIAEFAPAGQDASRLFRVENDTDEPIAVQISMVHRLMDIDGKEQMPEADDDFVVFPPQLVLTAREARTVRVQYVGDPKLAHEMPYRIVAEQLPVELEQNKQGARVRLLVRYEGAVYVAPPNVAPRAEVKSVERVQRSDGSPGMALVVENTGTAHALLNGLKLSFKTDNGGNVPVEQPEQLEGIFGENVLAGAARRFVIGWPQGLKTVPSSATLTFGRSGPQ